MQPDESFLLRPQSRSRSLSVAKPKNSFDSRISVGTHISHNLLMDPIRGRAVSKRSQAAALSQMTEDTGGNNNFHKHHGSARQLHLPGSSKGSKSSLHGKVRD